MKLHSAIEYCKTIVQSRCEEMRAVLHCKKWIVVVTKFSGVPSHSLCTDTCNWGHDYGKAVKAKNLARSKVIQDGQECDTP